MCAWQNKHQCKSSAYVQYVIYFKMKYKADANSSNSQKIVKYQQSSLPTME